MNGGFGAWPVKDIKVDELLDTYGRSLSDFLPVDVVSVGPGGPTSLTSHNNQLNQAVHLRHGQPVTNAHTQSMSSVQVQNIPQLALHVQHESQLIQRQRQQQQQLRQPQQSQQAQQQSSHLTADDQIHPQLHHIVTDGNVVPGEENDNNIVSEQNQLIGEENKKRRTISNTKRAAQNRSAQKAFRVRREKYIKELEVQAAEVNQLKETIEELRAENLQLRDYTLALQSRVIELSSTHHTLGPNSDHIPQLPAAVHNISSRFTQDK